MTLFCIGLKWQWHWHECSQAHGSKRGNCWPGNTVWPAALRQPPCLLFICTAGRPREMLRGWVPAGCLAVDDKEGGSGSVAAAGAAGSGSWGWGTGTVAEAARGSSREGHPGLLRGFCGDILSQQMYGRAEKNYVFARRVLQLLSNTRGIMLWQEFLQMTNIFHLAYLIQGTEKNWGFFCSKPVCISTASQQGCLQLQRSVGR